MRKWFTLILLLGLLSPSPARAQTEITLESLNVLLLPEYDQPSMLVIYDFDVAEGISLPVRVDLRVPQSANISAIAYLEEGDFVNAEFSGPEDDGAWQVISFFVRKATTYHLEYYENLEFDGDKRAFKYQWPGDYTVNNLRVELRVPADSTGVRASPMIPLVPGQSFLNGSVSLGKYEAGKKYQLDLKYTRLSTEPVTKTGETVSAAPIAEQTTGRVTLNSLPYYLIGFGVLLIAGAVFYFRSSHANGAPGKTRKRVRKATEEEPTQMYCHECGARAQGPDRFCRVCGTKLRA